MLVPFSFLSTLIDDLALSVLYCPVKCVLVTPLKIITDQKNTYPAKKVYLQRRTTIFLAYARAFAILKFINILEQEHGLIRVWLEG